MKKKTSTIVLSILVLAAFFCVAAIVLLLTSRRNIGGSLADPRQADKIRDNKTNATKLDDAVPPAAEDYSADICSDGSARGRCAKTKPDYCGDGGLTAKCFECGCPDDGSVCSAEGACLPPKSRCEMIHEGNKDRSKALNIIVVGADALYDGPAYRYSGKFDVFSGDARAAVDKFLSIPPFDRYKNVFNFYRYDTIVQCPEYPIYIYGKGFALKEQDLCKGWGEAAKVCGITPDLTIVLVNTDSKNGVMRKTMIIVEPDGVAWAHEISHALGLVDESYYMGPNSTNIFKGLENCGKPLCAMQPTLANLFAGDEFTDIPGGTCCYRLDNITVSPVVYGDYYSTNERSVMKVFSGRTEKFSIEARKYLEKYLARVAAGSEASGVFGIALKRCPDGTLEGRCSAAKPERCVEGRLIPGCAECGCPAGMACGSNGECQ